MIFHFKMTQIIKQLILHGTLKEIDTRNIKLLMHDANTPNLYYRARDAL